MVNSSLQMARLGCGKSSQEVLQLNRHQMSLVTYHPGAENMR